MKANGFPRVLVQDLAYSEPPTRVAHTRADISAAEAALHRV